MSHVVSPSTSTGSGGFIALRRLLLSELSIYDIARVKHVKHTSAGHYFGFAAREVVGVASPPVSSVAIREQEASRGDVFFEKRSGRKRGMLPIGPFSISFESLNLHGDKSGMSPSEDTQIFGTVKESDEERENSARREVVATTTIEKTGGTRRHRAPFQFIWWSKGGEVIRALIKGLKGGALSPRELERKLWTEELEGSLFALLRLLLIGDVAWLMEAVKDKAKGGGGLRLVPPSPCDFLATIAHWAHNADFDKAIAPYINDTATINRSIPQIGGERSKSGFTHNVCETSCAGLQLVAASKSGFTHNVCGINPQLVAASKRGLSASSRSRSNSRSRSRSESRSRSRRSRSSSNSSRSSNWSDRGERRTARGNAGDIRHHRHSHHRKRYKTSRAPTRTRSRSPSPVSKSPPSHSPDNEKPTLFAETLTVSRLIPYEVWMAMPIVSVTSESVDRANAKLVGNVMCEEMVIAATDSPSETITKGMTVQQDVMEERHTSLSPTYAPSSPAACCMTPETRAPAAPNASKWKRAVTLEGKHKDRVYEWHEETRATRWYEVKQWRLVTTSAGTYEFHCETQETRWLRDEEGPRPTACEFGEHVPIPVDWQKQ